MHMDRLGHYNDALRRDFDNASSDIAALRDTLHDQVLTQINLELGLTKSDIAWLAEWLSDTGSIFRLFRRHKFIRPFALQEIHNITLWRLRILRPLLLLPLPALFHCLPPPIKDPFGRPILFLKLASLQSMTYSLKDALLQEMERLRLHLRSIRENTGSFPLQYLVLVDLDGVSMQNYNLDLCSWILTDVVPRYPGMLAAVFILNYSWIHSGAWSLAMRVLPSSVIARVCFPSQAQLVNYCSAANLPAEYGGVLPTLDQIDNPLRSPYQSHHLPTFQAQPTSPPQRVPSTIPLAPMSSQNPFFGYPAIVSASSPHTIRHVRKGWPALVRTLVVLWWRRWSRWVTWMGVSALVLALALRMRRARAKVPVRG